MMAKPFDKKARRKRPNKARGPLRNKAQHPKPDKVNAG